MEFNSNFKYDLKLGQESEKEVANLLLSGADTFEVKMSKKSWKTGKLFIEYESRGKPSGISTTQAAYWCFAFMDSTAKIFVSTEELKQICKKHSFSINGGDSNTSKGYLVPILQLIQPRESVNV